VAVGKLLGLSEEQMAHAIGIAATQVTGLREMFGSDTKSFHVGRAAQNGLMAAVLASHGYTSSTRALEAKRGWANVVSEKQGLDAQIASLGQIWETEKNSFKPFPCGIVVHPIIDGCVQLHEEMEGSAQKGLSVAQIERVHAKVHPLVLELTGKKTPQDGLQAKFSVYHGGAIGLVLGKAGPAQYEDYVVRDQQIISVRDKIEAVADEAIRPDEAEIVVEFSDGQKLTKRVSHAIGSLENPMTDKNLQDKFVDQVSQAIGMEEARKASGACWAVEAASNVGQLAKDLSY
jgi:aconitate decarboxylase